MPKKKTGGPGRNQGRKPLGIDRGGLVLVPVSIYADQKARLNGLNVSATIRKALDLYMQKDAVEQG